MNLQTNNLKTYNIMKITNKQTQNIFEISGDGTLRTNETIHTKNIIINNNINIKNTLNLQLKTIKSVAKWLI